MHHPSSLSSPIAHSLLDLIQTNNDEVTEPTDGGKGGLQCSVRDVTKPAGYWTVFYSRQSFITITELNLLLANNLSNHFH